MAIDLEFTGLLSHKHYQAMNYDTAPTCYHKLRHCVQEFFPIQMGLCGFTQSADCATAYPFKFNILPLPNDNLDSNRQYMSSQTLQFLGRNNFDFNRLFYEGVEYASERDRQVMANLDIIEELSRINREQK